MRVFRCAEAVVRQRFDDPAVADAAVPAFADHAGQLPLQCLQAGDPALDLAEMVPGDAVSLVTGGLRLGAHGQEFTNVVDLEPEFPGVADEVEPVDLGLAIAALSAT